jgi:ABC-type antimicrobial peptide transport system permease subunit
MYGVRTMNDRVDQSLARRRFSMLLLVLFAAVAFGLAVIGVYGVVAFLVGQGRREIGIRVALGATPRNILSFVIRQGAALALVGTAIGLVAATAFARFIESLLFGVTARDVPTFVAVAVMLTAVATLASLIPAFRAARVDPTESLRSE